MEMHALYQQEELPRAEAARRRAGTAMAVVAGVGFVACVALCCLATRQNQRLTLPLTIGASVLSGWIVIFLSHSRYEGAKARVRHLETMLTGPRERYAGRFTKQEGVYRVKRGVSIRKVRLQEELHESMLTVADEKVPLLPDEFTGTAETVYDCIVAWAEADASAPKEVGP